MRKWEGGLRPPSPQRRRTMFEALDSLRVAAASLSTAGQWGAIAIVTVALTMMIYFWVQATTEY